MTDIITSSQLFRPSHSKHLRGVGAIMGRGRLLGRAGVGKMKIGIKIQLIIIIS